MKILAIGVAGEMGRAVVSYFVTDPETEVLGLMDVQENVLTQAATGIASWRVNSR